MALEYNAIKNDPRVALYQAQLVEEAKKRRRRRFGNPLILLLLMIALYAAVKYGHYWGVPPAASQYLLETPFLSFNNQQLNRVASELSPEVYVYYLVPAVYWLYHLVGALLLISVSVSIFPWSLRSFRSRKFIHREGILATSVLLERLVAFNSAGSVFSAVRLFFAFHRVSSIAIATSPLKKGWYKDPVRQWLETKDIPRDKRSIIFALSAFTPTNINPPRSPENFEKVKSAIEHLHAFYLLVAVSSEESLNRHFSRFDIPSPVSCLTVFSKQTRALLIEAKRTKADAPRQSRFTIWIKNIVFSQLVRTALIISTIGGLVMLLGVLLFKIDAKSAFLTWFSVAFGSLTLSIGIRSFRLAGKEQGPE
ncbi:MAG: hypothetical protein WD397_01270 [Wenzhouxiangellaceae bacterium]